MNYSDKYKYIILTPPRMGTRALSHPFGKIGFTNDIENSSAFTHRLEIPEGKEDYKIISTIRNPYKRYLSVYRWQSIFEPDNLHETSVAHMDDYFQLLKIDELFGIDYWVDTDNMKSDLENIPVIGELVSNDESVIESRYKNEGKKEGVITQEIADEIYQTYKVIFDKFGYDKESWK